MRRFDKLKKSKEGLVNAVYRAAKDGISAIKLDPVSLQPYKSGAGKPEIAIAVLSDFQLAKVTPTYNSKVCEERIDLYGDKVLRLTDIQRADHPVDELRVWLLGDIVEGELIFAGQSHLIDASLYRQVTIDGPRILGNFFRKMLTKFKIIKVTAVIGNHGAFGGVARREMNGESNADRMLYRILQLMFQNEPRIQFVIPEGDGERAWYAVDYVGEHGYLLCHGDQFRFGIKTPSAEQKILGWRTGAIPEKFEEVVCGHWHQPNRLALRGGTTTLRCNGSTESYNTYAQEFVGSMNTPSQWLLFANEHHGTTAEYLVWL